MNKLAAFVSLLLISTVGCGGQQPPESAPVPTQDAATAAPPATATAPTNTTPSATTRSPADEASTAIPAGEELDSSDDEPAATRANTLLAASMTQPKPEANSRWQQGTNYQVLLPAQPTNVAPDKVEVVEAFWYGCPHCYALDPYLENWKTKKPPYVQFTRLHVTWGPVHRAHARLFYTLEALGRSDLNAAVFREIHVNHDMLASNDPIETEQMQMQFARRNGISEEDFRKAYNSFAVETNLQRAEQLTRRYRVEAVPMIVINGKYTTDIAMAGGQNQLIELINDLAAREQKKE